MQARALTADDFITEIQFLQSRAGHYWKKAVDQLEKLQGFASTSDFYVFTAGKVVQAVV